MYRLREINPLHEKYGHLSLVVFGVGVLLLGLLLRSDFFLSIVDFVLELLGWAGILGGAAIAAAGVVAYGNERGWWDRLIESSGQSEKRLPMVRGLSSSALFLLVLLFFFLPWMSVSCFGEELVTVSGTDIMDITKVDDIPSEIANDDYSIGDALGSEAALLYVAALLVIVGGSVFLPARRTGKLHTGRTCRRGAAVSARVRLPDPVLRGVGTGRRNRRARGGRSRDRLEDRILVVASGSGCRHRPAVHPDAVRQ